MGQKTGATDVASALVDGYAIVKSHMLLHGQERLLEVIVLCPFTLKNTRLWTRHGKSFCKFWVLSFTFCSAKTEKEKKLWSKTVIWRPWKTRDSKSPSMLVRCCSSWTAPFEIHWNWLKLKVLNFSKLQTQPSFTAFLKNTKNRKNWYQIDTNFPKIICTFVPFNN